MNSIEKGKITDVDEALDYIIPGVFPFYVRNMYKEQLKKLLPTESIINKANTLYISKQADIYLDFYLKFLLLADEKAYLVTSDNSNIALSAIISRAEHQEDAFMPVPMRDVISNMDESTYLAIEKVKNLRLRYMLDHWTYSKLYDEEKDIFYLQLLPATTCVHLHKLYKVLCTYL